MMSPLKVWQFAVCSGHCSCRSDYKQGSSGAIVQHLQSSGISTVKKTTRFEEAHITNSEPVFLCSASVQSQVGSVLCVSIQKHFELMSSKSLCVLFAVKAEKYFVFVFFVRMAALDCNRSCCVTAGKNTHTLVKGGIQSVFRRQRKKNFFLFQCFLHVSTNLIVMCHVDN